MAPSRIRFLSIAGSIAIFAVATSASAQEPAAPLASAPWLVTGNATRAGSFLGTTDDKPLVFKSGGREAMRILPNLDIGIGTGAPTSRLTVNAATTGAPVLSVTETSEHKNSDAISGVSYGAGGAGVYGDGAGINGYGVYGYNGATGNAGYFLVDGFDVPGGNGVTDTANAAVFAVTNAGSKSEARYYGPAAAFVVENPDNLSPAVIVQALNAPAMYVTSVDNGIVAKAAAYAGAVVADGGSLGVAAQVQNGRGGLGYCYFNGGPGWSCGTNAALRKHAERVDPRRVLRQLATMPLSYYEMQGARDPGVRYLGPRAEDFKAAFDLGGADNRVIDTANVEGVALAAIKGLYQELQAKDKEIAELKAENAALRAQMDARLTALETRLGAQTGLRHPKDRGGIMASFHLRNSPSPGSENDTSVSGR